MFKKIQQDIQISFIIIIINRFFFIILMFLFKQIKEKKRK